MTKLDVEKPFYVYRENKGYFYGPGAGPALDGKPVDWKTTPRDKVENSKDDER